MKSLVFLLEQILNDASIWCSACTTRDFNTVTRRVENEGISFLTITLPSFCKDFERSLDDGEIAPISFAGFQRRGSTRYFDSNGRGVLPRFLGGLLELIFDKYTGVLLDEPNVDAIFFVRQITLVYKKVLLSTTDERTHRAFKKYVECEEEVKAFSDSVSRDLIARFADTAGLLWGSVLSAVDRKVYQHEHVPKHGPGATAERISGNGKYDIRTWHTRLEEFFPSAEYAIPNPGFFRDLEAVDFLDPDTESPSRIISVPKTLKTPRIIAIEPVCMQYTQQSLMEMLVQYLERDDFLSDSVGFTDQTRNQKMAMIGSMDLEGRGLATIDLSEASDRVSNLLVKTMFKPYKSLDGALQACRTVRADVPGFGVIPLAKFASMGSATTFPVEAMVFLTIVASAFIRSKGLGIHSKSTRTLLGHLLRVVRVYGDDIIVPKDLAYDVTLELESYGLKVNTSKSFWTGKFRESCGRDYYDGSDVTVTYCRRVFPESHRDASEIISLVSLRNQFYEAGLWKTVEYLDKQIGRLAPFPIVEKTSQIIGRFSFLPYRKERDCPRLHRPLVKGLVSKSQSPINSIDGVGALMKFFLKRGLEPTFDPKHLDRSGRPQRVYTKVEWSCPF